MSAQLHREAIEGLHLFAELGIGVCGMCGVLVFLRMVERHRRFCEPRDPELEPIAPGELGPGGG